MYRNVIKLGGELQMKIGTTYWITGLSGAGKPTIGRLLYETINEKKSNIVFLDGDILRQVYNTTDYSSEGRLRLAMQHSRLCKMLNEQGIDVVICVIAMYDECREWNRDNIENYVEVYLDVDIEELIHRDQKQLYSRALKNEIDNVMGINMDFDEPKNPNLRIDNSGRYTPKEVVDMILKYIDG